MNPTKTEKGGKVVLATVLVALGTAAKKYGPVVVEKAKETIPIILKSIFKRG